MEESGEVNKAVTDERTSSDFLMEKPSRRTDALTEALPWYNRSFLIFYGESNADTKMYP